MMVLYFYMKDVTSNSDYMRGVSDSSSWRTAIKGDQPTFLDGVSVLLEVLDSNAKRLPRSNWKSRVVVDAYGVESLSTVVTLSAIYTTYHNYGGYSAGTLPVRLRTHASGNFTTFTCIKEFATAIAEAYPNGASFYRTDAQGRRNWAWYSALTIEDDVISYRVTGKSHFLNVNNKNGWYAISDVVIRRKSDDSCVLTYLMPTAYRVQNDVLTTQFSTGFTSIYDQKFTDKLFDEPNDQFEVLSPVLTQSILAGTPALYVTQSKALYSMMGNYSRNLETFLESPGLLVLFKEWSAVRRDDWLAKAGKYGIPREAYHFINLFKAICGLTLLYNLALKPTLATVTDLLDDVLAEINVKTEASISFTSDEYDMADLPEGLEQFAFGPWGSQIESFSIVFRSEVTPSFTRLDMSKSIEAAALLATWGASFSPSLIWELTPMSLVVDQFRPIGQYIKAMERTVSGLTQRGHYAIGHSVSIKFTMQGIEYVCFIRSDPSNDLIRPTSRVWLPDTSLPQHIAVPLALVLVL